MLREFWRLLLRFHGSRTLVVDLLLAEVPGLCTLGERLNLAPASDVLGVVRMGHTRRSLFLSREAGRESLANQIPQLHVSVVFQCLGSENLEKYQFKPAERHRDVVLLLIRAVVIAGDTSSTS